VIPLEVLASLSADDTAIVLAVVGARLLIPLSPRGRRTDESRSQIGLRAQSI
jgi:hypothetical protein